MQLITCTARFHRQQERIFLLCEYSSAINAILKKLPGIKWSQTHKQWHLPLTNASYQQLCKAMKGTSAIEDDALKAYLQKKKQGSAPNGVAVAGNLTNPVNVQGEASPATAFVINKLVAARKISGAEPVKTKALPAAVKIAAVNSHVLPALKQTLTLKAYSPSSVKTYMNEVQQFLQHIKGYPADAFTTQRLKDYLQYCFEKLHLSENTLHSRINALKFYYEQVLKKDKLFWEIPRPKKPSLLPKLLNETELRKLFNALANRKHKAMLFCAYSAGLRVSEIVNLKIADIDSKRMQIFIARAKGKKDRYVNLSPVVLDILRKYLREYKLRPALYLFESEQTLTCYPTRTVQQIFSAAKLKAGIAKTVGVHSLRHSFATHLLEKGTDIRYIKDILGHFNIKTTERYLHVANKQLVNIVSPFDDLWKGNDIDW